MARIGRTPAPGTVLRTPTGKGASGSRKGASPTKGSVPAAFKAYQFKAGGGRRGGGKKGK